MAECPRCGDPATSHSFDGERARLSPCGCAVSLATAKAVARGEDPPMVTDGGDPLRDEAGPVARVFEEASGAVLDDRGETHGSIHDNFGQIADLWAAYLGCHVDPVDVAVLNILQKVSRQDAGSRDEDHYVDMAGYAAIANGLARARPDSDEDGLRTDGGEVVDPSPRTLSDPRDAAAKRVDETADEDAPDALACLSWADRMLAIARERTESAQTLGAIDKSREWLDSAETSEEVARDDA